MDLRRDRDRYFPEDRSTAAVLFMEDVDQLMLVDGPESLEPMRHKLLTSMAQSVTEIGRNQRVHFREIVLDLTLREIRGGEVGCALVAMPYFHLAKRAYRESLPDELLRCWLEGIGRSPLREAGRMEGVALSG